MLIAAAIGIALGNWQTRRALEKEAIEAALSVRSTAPLTEVGALPMSADALEYRQVRVTGEFIRDWPVYLDNRPYQGKAGFYLLMPLKIAGADTAVLVARGWIARDVADRAQLPKLETPAGVVEIQGMARRQAGRLFQLGESVPLRSGAIVQNVKIQEFAAAAGLKLQPFLIEQTSDAQDGLVRDWPRPSHGADKHRGYAFQWYGLAATACLFFVVTGFRRGTKH